MADQWYLSFDCATKTFAFSLSRISGALDRRAENSSAGHLEALAARLAAAEELHRRAAAAVAAADSRAAAPLLSALQPAVATLRTEIGRLIEIADGGVVDLAPGRADADVSTVERIRALAVYLATRVRPALARCGDEPWVVLIEYQMGPNARARAIAAALVALFADATVYFVGPSLKNRVRVAPGLEYGVFARRYANTYGANKAHAARSFAAVEAAYGSGVGATTPALRGHIADSFMQVLGHLRFGLSNELAAGAF